jgi:hypothetical protein
MIINSKSEEEILEILSNNFKNLKFVSSELRKNKEFILKIIDLMEDSYGRLFKYIPQYLNNDYDIALKLVKLDGMVLENISTKLKDNEKIVRAAINNNPFAAMFASKKLLDNKDLALIAVNKEGGAFSYFSERLRSDKDVVLPAVKNNGEALLYVFGELKKDKEIVLAAIKSNKKAVLFTPNELFSDKEVALEALRQETLAYVYFPEDLNQQIKGFSHQEAIRHLEKLLMSQQLEEELVHKTIKEKKIKL